MIWLYLLPKRLRGKLKQHRSVIWLFNLLTIFLICCLCFVLLFKFIEGVSWGDAIWQVWQTVTTVGYGDRPVETTWGRIITIIVGTTGLSLLPAFVAAGFEFLISIRDRRRYGLMKNPHKDGYVIFNFPGVTKFQSFVREIRHIEDNVGICVVDGRIEELPPSVSMVHNVHFIRGNILSKDTYHMAGLRENKAVIVFPINPSAPDSDSSTKTIVDLVEQFDPDTRIIHVIVDPQNSWLFKKSSSTQTFEGLDVLAVVQECQDKYSAEIMENILLNTEGVHPKTIQPDLVIGWTWYKFMERSIQVGKAMEVQVNPIAIIKNGQIHTCPAFDTVIEKDDLISIITNIEFKWAEFEKALIKK